MQTGAFDDGQWYSLNQRTDSGPETAFTETWTYLTLGTTSVRAITQPGTAECSCTEPIAGA
jgi:hypothetical protein